MQETNEEEMDPTLLNTGIGILAGLITIITGVFTIVQAVKGKEGKLPSSPPGNKPTKVPHGGGGKGGDTTPLETTPANVPGVQEFSGDDKAYQEWLTKHPQGFVVNTNRGINPNYMVLHKATCSHVSNFDARRQGAFTEGDFMKACATGKDPLRAWASKHGRADGSFTGECSICKP